MLIGIDYGLKNIGIAISDRDEKLALSYKTLNYKNLLSDISGIIKEKEIRKIIIGLPLKENGMESILLKRMREFVARLNEFFPNIEIIELDESMSTQIAINYLKDMGFNYKSVQKFKDQESARVILQSYIENK